MRGQDAVFNVRILDNLIDIKLDCTAGMLF